jgi:photosystem II stability/assembly factor-like uncharacterized protein
MKRLFYISLVIIAVVTFNTVTFSPVHASDDLEWAWVNPYPQGDNLEAISYGNDIFVAVGVHGTIITSADRLNWNIQSSGTAENLYDVRWFDSLQQFLCVGDAGTVLMSPDGASWTQLNTGLPAGQLRGIEHSGNQYVILEDRRYVQVSDDGIDWSRVDLAAVLPAYLYFHDITWSGNKYVIAGQGGSVITSDNGTTWMLQTTPVTDVLFGVVWAGYPQNQFVAVGNGGTVLTSSDGVNWDEQGTDTMGTLKDVMWDGNQFVAVGSPLYAGENILVLTSSDGSSWTGHNANFRASLAGVAGDGNYYLAIGDGGTILESQDGVSWNTISHGVSQDLWDVTWNGNQFVAVGDKGTIVTSPDGFDWTQQPVNLQGSPSLRGITWNGDNFTAVGQYATLLFSSDGEAWNKHSTGQIMNITFQDVIWAGPPLNKYIIVGSLGTILTSADGTTWTKHDLGPDFSFHVLKSIAWNGDKLVVIGSGLSITDRVIITSPNGGDWTVNNTNIGFNDVISDESQFIAVSSGQHIYTSADGEVWNQGNSSASSALLSGVAWNGSRYVAVGRTMVNSLDSLNWEEQPSITMNALYGITWGVTKFVAVGQAGTILTSFTTLIPAPTITSLDLVSATPGDEISITMIGNNLSGATAVNFGAGIILNSFTVDNPTQMTANITISYDAVTGTRDVSVTTPGGIATLANGFTVEKVLSPPTPTPTPTPAPAPTPTPAPAPTPAPTPTLPGGGLSCERITGPQASGLGDLALLLGIVFVCFGLTRFRRR